MTEHEYDQFKQAKKETVTFSRNWPVTITALVFLLLSLFVGYESCIIFLDNTWLSIVGIIFSLGLGFLSLVVVASGSVKAAIENISFFLIGTLIP